MVKPNEGKADRAIRFIVGSGLVLVSYLYLSGIGQTILYVIGGIFVFTAITGFCGLYKILGINTNKEQE